MPVPNKKDVAAKKRFQMKKKLKLVMACKICNIKFNKSDIGAKRKICYKDHCAYLYALNQSNLWLEKAQFAKARCDRENGPEKALDCPLDDDDVQQPQWVQEMVSNPKRPAHMEPRSTCRYPNCRTTYKDCDVTEMVTRNLEVFMDAKSIGIGRCPQCVTEQRQNPYWCSKHYLKHESHIENNASFYSCNGPATPTQQPLPTLPTIPELPSPLPWLPAPEFNTWTPYDSENSFTLDDPILNLDLGLES